MPTKAIFPTFFNKETKIWSGPPRPTMYAQDTSIGQIIYSSLRCWPTNVIQVNDCVTPGAPGLWSLMSSII